MIRAAIGLMALFLIAGCSGTNSGASKQQRMSNYSQTPQVSSIAIDRVDNLSRMKMHMNQIPEPASQWMNGRVDDVPPAAPVAVTNEMQQVLELVNQERSKAGASPLNLDDSLSRVAMTKAKDMYANHYFDHQSPSYGSPFDMMNAFGILYNQAAENIAKGAADPASVMSQWMGSPGHSKNILNSSYKKIGIAHYEDEWVQLFTD